MEVLNTFCFKAFSVAGFEGLWAAATQSTKLCSTNKAVCLKRWWTRHRSLPVQGIRGTEPRSVIFYMLYKEFSIVITQQITKRNRFVIGLLRQL